jgi:two-component system CheB/CheR fusion protein
LTEPTSDTGDLERLLEYLRDSRGFDFTAYKRSTLERRIRRRLEARRCASYDLYQELLEVEPDEFIDLFDTILINVTSFFRDKETWDLVGDQVIPRLIDQLDQRPDPLRVWVAGCATGEEAYTVAMILSGALGDERFRDLVKIYATDVDLEALTIARHGDYAQTKVAEQVAEELVERCFVGGDGVLSFRKDLRRSIVFGRHDLIQDPPISRIDLLVCRNTLMYFTTAAQRLILDSLHFAVRDTGFLLLGRSEALATRVDLFTPFNPQHRVFVRRSGRTLRAAGRPLPAAGSEHDADPDDMSSIRDSGFDAAAVVQLVIDDRGHLSLANHQARTVLGLAARDVGRPLQDLEVSYRPLELRSRVDQVRVERRPIHVRNVELLTPEGSRWYDVYLTPLIGTTGQFQGVSVSFLDVSSSRRLQDELDRSQGELDTAHEELQSTVEELETTNEELQSTNEELETTNEELQSTNEELETMNEELQSSNEELETINDELRQRTDDLNDVNTFLEAVLASMQSAVVVVDREMRVEVWNDEARELWGLRAEEVEGEHLMNLDIGLPVVGLRKPILDGLNGQEPASEVVVDGVNRRGRPIECRVRVAPLRRRNGDIIGVILVMEAMEAATTTEDRPSV